MSFSKTPLGKLKLRVQIVMADLFQFTCLIFLGFLEFFHDHKPLAVKEVIKSAKLEKED